MVATSENSGVAFGLVCMAGACTGIGGAVVFFPSLVRLASRTMLAAALGLSAGVMTYVSFAEIFIKSQKSFHDAGFSENHSQIYATLCFFSGVVLMIALNSLVTWILGGHHHGGGTGGGTAASQTARTQGKDTRKETSDPEYQQEQDEESSGVSDDDEEDDPVPTCPCHDDNPIQTLQKVQDMAQSMAAHPNRAHPHGMHHHHDHAANKEAVAAPGVAVDDAHDVDKEEISSIPDVPVQNAEVIGGQAKPEQNAIREVPSAVSFRKQDTPSKALSAFNDENQRNSRKSGVHFPADKGGVSECYDESSDNDDSQDDGVGDDEEEDQERNRKLMRMSLNTAVAIILHNFPEGLATFVASLNDSRVGAVLAVAISIHNIPEGLCVAMPIYYATGNRWKAFCWALLSGIAEPFAGLLGWIVLAQSFSDQMYALLFGLVAGMMVIISVRELLPTAHRYDPEDHVVTYAYVVGMVIMALSLMLFLL